MRCARPCRRCHISNSCASRRWRCPWSRRYEKPGVRCQVLVCAVLLCAFAATGQVAKQANEGYKTPEGRDSVAKTLSAADRDEKQKPRELVAAMSLKPG